jgi:hypothetical protein
MKRARITLRHFLFVLAASLAGACAPLPDTHQQPETGEVIGTLGVSGPNVFNNGKRAQNGDPVRLGDTITTGQNSSGIIEFHSGGFFQLDENTDPIFLLKRLQKGICVVARIFSGQAFVDKQEFCIETPALDAVNNSQINIRVQAQLTGLTVLKGNVSLTRPSAAHVRAGQQAIVTEKGEVRLRRLSDAQLRETVRWRDSYTFHGWCCVDGRLVAADRDQCPASFSFDQTRLEKRCAPRSETPRLHFDFGLPIPRGSKPKPTPPVE